MGGCAARFDASATMSRMNSVSEAQARVGRVVAGKYTLERLLGEGGMGAVYVAEHAFTKRAVAVKLMHAAFTKSRVAAERFIREAQAPSKIGHPGLAQVLDGGYDSDGTLYLVLELLSGGTLAEAMRGGDLEVEDLAEIGIELLDALEAAHGAGFIHRDIKPENIFLADDGKGGTQVKLLDFGIASLAQTDQHLTMTGAILGTPLYMSPEQAKGQSVDASSDLWAVGAVLYSAFAGRPPFSGDTYNALIVSIATSEHVPLQQLRPGLPQPLLHVIERALRKDRGRRWRSATHMREALCGALARAARTAAESGVRTMAQAGADARGPGPAQGEPGGSGPETRRHRPQAVPLAALSRAAGQTEAGPFRSGAPSSMVRAPWFWGALAGALVLMAGVGMVLSRGQSGDTVRRADLDPTPAGAAPRQAPNTKHRRSVEPEGAEAARGALPRAAQPEPVVTGMDSPREVGKVAGEPDTRPRRAPAGAGSHVGAKPARRPAGQFDTFDTPSHAPGRISTEVLARIVAQHRPDLERCYQDTLAEALVHDPAAAAAPVRIDVTLHVAANGAVNRTGLRGSSNGRLEACLRRGFGSLAFPAPGAATEVAFPLVFQPAILGGGAPE